MDIGAILSAFESDLEPVAGAQPAGSKAVRSSGRSDAIAARFADVWSDAHVYTLIYAAKAPQGEGAALNSNGQELQEWYMAICLGEGTHPAHVFTFGASSNEYRKHGSRKVAADGTVLRKGHAMSMANGRTLSSVRSSIHAQEPVAGLYAKALAKAQATLASLTSQPDASQTPSDEPQAGRRSR